MKRLPALALTLSLGLLSTTFVVAQDAADAPNSKRPTTKPTRAGARLIKPWSDLTSLTPEQKSKIVAIHKAGVAERKASEDKEHDDIMALLTDDQKAEVEKLKDDATVTKKAKATTQPDGGM